LHFTFLFPQVRTTSHPIAHKDFAAFSKGISTSAGKMQKKEFLLFILPLHFLVTLRVVTVQTRPTPNNNFQLEEKTAMHRKIPAITRSITVCPNERPPFSTPAKSFRNEASTTKRVTPNLTLASMQTAPQAYEKQQNSTTPNSTTETNASAYKKIRDPFLRRVYPV
jgi:hypothetical protein